MLESDNLKSQGEVMRKY